MPATLESLAAKKRDLAVEIVSGDPDSVITVTYKPLTFSRRRMRENKALAASDDQVELVFRAFLDLVTSWDFRPSEGEDVVPLTEDALDDVDMEILGTIVAAIHDDQSPKGVTTT